MNVDFAAIVAKAREMLASGEYPDLLTANRADLMAGADGDAVRACDDWHTSFAWLAENATENAGFEWPSQPDVYADILGALLDGLEDLVGYPEPERDRETGAYTGGLE